MYLYVTHLCLYTHTDTHTHANIYVYINFKINKYKLNSLYSSILYSYSITPLKTIVKQHIKHENSNNTFL